MILAVIRKCFPKTWTPLKCGRQAISFTHKWELLTISIAQYTTFMDALAIVLIHSNFISRGNIPDDKKKFDYCFVRFVLGRHGATCRLCVVGMEWKHCVLPKRLCLRKKFRISMCSWLGGWPTQKSIAMNSNWLFEDQQHC